MELTNLKELVLSLTDTSLDFEDQFKLTLGRLVKNSQQLEEMQMWSTMDDDSILLENIPFARLTALTLPRVYVQNSSVFVASLAQCIRLRTLSISLNLCISQSSRPYTIAIPLLTALDIVGAKSYIADVDTFLEIFHLPSLTSLSIYETYDCSRAA